MRPRHRTYRSAMFTQQTPPRTVIRLIHTINDKGNKIFRGGARLLDDADERPRSELEERGWFDVEQKQQPPAFPELTGVVTSLSRCSLRRPECDPRLGSFRRHHRWYRASPDRRWSRTHEGSRATRTWAPSRTTGTALRVRESPFERAVTGHERDPFHSSNRRFRGMSHPCEPAKSGA